MMWTVTTRDVDGGTSRRYKTERAAVRRFEEMLGCSVGSALAEMYYHRQVVPTLAEVDKVRGVSYYGTVVTLRRD